MDLKNRLRPLFCRLEQRLMAFSPARPIILLQIWVENWYPDTPPRPPPPCFCPPSIPTTYAISEPSPPSWHCLYTFLPFSRFFTLLDDIRSISPKTLALAGIRTRNLQKISSRFANMLLGVYNAPELSSRICCCWTDIR